MQIFAEILCRERASNDSGVVMNGNLQRFRWLFFRALETMPALLYSHAQSVVVFSVIPKCMTSNDLEWLFRRASLAGSDCATFEK